MPSPSEFWSIWRFDALAAALIIVAAGAYCWWLVIAWRRGTRWPVLRTMSFVAAVLLFAILQFGIVGEYDRVLRWAFTLRLALLFFAVPTFAAFGAPFDLLRAGGPPRLAAISDAILQSKAVRILGNAIVSPLVGLALFSMLLTPLSATVRTSEVGSVLITVLVAPLGFFLIGPVATASVARSSTFVTIEFLLTFVELMLDAIPGIMLRITNHVIDGATVAAQGPAWFPAPLTDQHLAGDLLWFIAEIADIPVLIALFIRWQRSDRHEAKAIDALSDEEMEELTRAHLARYRER